MTFNWWTFLFEAINFVVLAYVLHRLLYRPLREAIEQRRDANARAQEAAEKARQEAVALRQGLQSQLASAEQQRQELIHQAREQAESERQRVLAESERAVQRRQEEARQALEREREAALKSLQNAVIAQSLDLTRRLIGEASERTLEQQLALRLVQTLEQLSDTATQALKATRRAADGPILESARDLDAATLERLTRTVSRIIGEPVSLSVKSRPDLLAGVRLLLAGHIWDGSLAGQLASADTGPGKAASP
jgi:F-type H+-transporting ATPase subunit b